MVMERVQGEELRRWIADGRTRAMAPRQIVDLAVAMLRALDTAHVRGVIHRDLKPENVMITKGGKPKIMDFGLARQVDRKSITTSDVMMGTPVYMSPEHTNAKRVTVASDIYSMGVIVYEMLGGRVPFEAEDMMGIIMKMLTEEPTPLHALRPDLPRDLTDVVMRMIAKDLDVRYADAGSVIDDLSRLTL